MKKNCQCGQCGPTTAGCPSGKLCRPRYFPRKLITDAEMTLEQDYFRDRLRLHNRLLHGWGVVCGARVCYEPAASGKPGEFEPWKVRVERGYVLGPYGDEIFIDAEVLVDLRTAQLCVADTDVPPEHARDPWCAPPPTCEEHGTLYLAVKYRQTLSHPVRVQPVGCGCDESACEYSRWCDGYELCLLRECPESHHVPATGEWGKGPVPTCPPCPEDPWVVLAEIVLGENGRIESIDDCSCRRLVFGLGHLAWNCNAPPKLAPQPTDVVGDHGHEEDHTKPMEPAKPAPEKVPVGGPPKTPGTKKPPGKKKAGKGGG